MFLLKFFTDKLRLKLISPKFSNQNKKSSISSTMSLVFIDFCTVFFGILLALYIDRWNSSQNIEKQFESTLKIIQKNLESDIYITLMMCLFLLLDIMNFTRKKN